MQRPTASHTSQPASAAAWTRAEQSAEEQPAASNHSQRRSCGWAPKQLACNAAGARTFKVEEDLPHGSRRGSDRHLNSGSVNVLCPVLVSR